MVNSKTWCVNPNIHLAVISTGEVAPCCTSTQPYKTDQGSKTLNQESIIKFWNSKDRHKLINQLNNNIRAKGCDHCWQEEDAGKISKRMRDNADWQHVNIQPDQLPITAYFSLGNLCNLKCRICSPDCSSPMAEEDSKISWISRTALKLSYDLESSRKSFLENNLGFWDNLLPLLHNVERIDFAGGEPMYVKNHWKIIDYLVNNNVSKNQIVHYTTNGTIFPTKYISALSTFKLVDISISIDAVGKKFEYIRHPANFKEVNSNIDKFLSIENAGNWYINSSLTVSIFNIWDLPETYEYCKSKGLPIFLNFTHDRSSIKSLPDKLKDTIIDRLLNHSSDFSEWYADRDIVINFLNNGNYNVVKWKFFLWELRQRDEYRNESFEKTFPDYYQEIKKYI